MTDVAAAADKLVAAYNAKDFDALEALIAPDLDFAHFNRDFAFDNREGLFEVLRQFSDSLMPDRAFEDPVRVNVLGDTVVREAHWSGTPQVDLPFGPAGEKVRLRFCSVLRFDDNGILVEWKDYG